MRPASWPIVDRCWHDRPEMIASACVFAVFAAIYVGLLIGLVDR